MFNLIGKVMGEPTAWKALVGGMLVHLCLGTLYSWGNVSVYITSYLRYCGAAVTGEQSLRVFAAAMLGQALTLSASGVLQHRLGPRLTCLLGAYLLALSVLASSRVTTLQGLELTYGMLFGVAIGLAYTAPLAVGFTWLPQKRGLVAGCTVAGFGGGAFIFNFVATSYVNPDNLSPIHETDGIFFGPEVAARVPGMFRLLGCCYFALTTLGLLLLRLPPDAVPMSALDRAAASSTSGIPSYQQVGGSELELAEVFVKQSAAAAVEEERQVTTLQLLFRPGFYVVVACFIMTATGGLLVSGTYKRFGQTAFRDDSFLTLVGSLSSICNAGGRVGWGLLSDRIGPLRALITMSAALAVLLATYSLSLSSRLAFAIWTCAIFGTFGGNFALWPVATGKIFGAVHVGGNYGAVLTVYNIAAGCAIIALASVSTAGGLVYRNTALVTLIGCFTVTGLLLRTQKRSVAI